LLEYQKYKKAAGELERRPILDRDVFVRLISAEPEEEEEKVDASLFELLEAFREVLKKVKPEVFHEVILERMTVEEKVQEVLSLLQKEKRSLAFHRLFPEQASRRMIVITFLAILELVKMKMVRIFQASPFEIIRLLPV
jgi:segregation and condensation protein A